MPRATTNSTDIERHDLKSCPGGFVVLRKLTYGQFLERREMVTKMAVSAGKNGQRNDFAGELSMANRKVTEFEFAHCIVEHNLTDDNDVNLNFSYAPTLQVLDPRIGEEIGQLIDSMNQFQADLGNSQSESVMQS